jgi:hypothetical protein
VSSGRRCRSRRGRRLVFVMVFAAALLACSIGAAAAGAGPPKRTSQARQQLDAYRGPGTWVDIYDPRVLGAPERSAARMSFLGVKTLFLETANYRQAPGVDIVNPLAVGRLVDAAHSAGMRVVAWYLPSLAKLNRDLRRSVAAIRFTTPSGGHFDSFALDIESTVIRRTLLRNRALLTLSRRLRTAVGRSYALGAIVPDQRSTAISPGLWPGFPYRATARLYDVFLPMSYSSHRGRGASYVYRYTRANIDFIRRSAGNMSLPVHPIGGLANRLGPAEARAVVRAAVDRGALGASFYKFSISGREAWTALRRLDE